MLRKSIVLSVLAVVALTFAVAAQAEKAVTQTTTQATVVSVGDNFLVLKMSNGTYKGFDVPAGFLFNEAGAKVPLSALRRGQAVTDTITTTSEPLVVHVEDVNAATVVRVVDRYLTVQLADGTYHRYFVPKGYRFDVDGKSLSVLQLQPGMKLSTTIVSENEVATMTKAEFEAEASKPVPPAEALKPVPPAEASKPVPPAEASKPVPPAEASKPVPPAEAATPAPSPVHHKKLPKTASQLPLIGLLGLLSLGFGVGLSVLRRG